MNHSDYITHINNPEDKPFLRSKLLDVNMRLFKTSGYYNHIIKLQCEYLKILVLTKMEGYKKPHGMSAANAGLAFNIITICRNRGKSNEYAQVMINPKVLGYGGAEVETESNCGSLTLKEPIKVARRELVEVAYYDENGIMNINTFGRNDCGFTIQHEIDHNLGILITDTTRAII